MLPEELVFPSLPIPGMLRAVGRQATRDVLWPDAVVFGSLSC